MGRDIATLKSIQVPALAPETHAEVEKHRQGAQRQAARTASRGDGAGDATVLAPEPQTRPSGSELTSLRQMHWQDRNTQGRIFGGALC